MRARNFYIGVADGLLLFAAANLYSYYTMKKGTTLIDGNVGFGLPFKFYVSGGYIGDALLWNALIADVFIGLCASIILGWVSQRLFRTRSRLS